MDLLNQINLNEAGVIITTSENKYNLIRKINEVEDLIQLQIFTLNEVETILDGEIDKEAIFVCQDLYFDEYHEKLNVMVAQKYLKTLNLIELDLEYDESILKFLQKLKYRLIEKKLLIISKYQQKLLMNKNIYYFDVELTPKLIKKLEVLNPKRLKPIKIENNYTPKLYSFGNHSEEVEFIANKIAGLIDKGIDVNKICIHIPASDYYSQVRVTFANYQIPLKPLKRRMLNSYHQVMTMKNLISEKNSLEPLFEMELSSKIEQNIFNQFIAIINQYPSYHNNVSRLLEIVEVDLNATQIKADNLQNVVREIDILKYYPQNDEHVFILNMAEQKVPKLIKDTKIMSDIQAEKYHQTPTYIENRLAKNILVNKLQSINNLTMSFATTTPTGEESMASVLTEFNYQNCQPDFDKVRYSKSSDIVNLAKAKELAIKFGTEDPLLTTFDALELPIQFDNQVNSDLPRNEDQTLSLSPTSIEKFFKCEFKFYVEQILKIRPQIGDTTMLELGNLFHYVMEHGLKNKITDSEQIFGLINKYNIDQKLCLTPTFIRKYTKYLKEILEQTVAFHENHDFHLSSESFEKEVKMIIDDQQKIELIGKIDKFLELDLDEKFYVAIVDYKTKTKPNIDHRLFKHGLDLQNFIYFYLLKQDRLDDEFELIGTFQHRIKPSVKPENPKFSDEFKLFGYATSNEEKLRQFEPNFADKKLTKLANVQVTKSGFGKHAKVADEEAIAEFNKIVEQKIAEVTDAINHKRFQINPKRLKKKDISCDNCHLRPICLRMNKNYVELSEEEDA